MHDQISEFFNKLMHYEWIDLAGFFIAAGIGVMVAAAVVILGCLWCRAARLGPNCRFGYRTAVSNQSEEAWTFVNHGIGITWIVMGILFAVASILSIWSVRHWDEGTVKSYAIVLYLTEFLCMGLSHIGMAIASKMKFPVR